MADIVVEEIEMISDISEGSSSSADGGDGGGWLPEPIKGVRENSLSPFVTKLFDTVSNEATNSTISWVPNLDLAQNENQVHNGATSFAIWNYHDFVNNVLPKISRSNNFNSFVSQLNNYGFKKISWDRREYAHEWFQEGKPQLLKNITRRGKQNTSMADKIMLEIKKLERETKELDHDLNKLKEYMDNTMSNQKRIVQAMSKAIKSTFGHHHHVLNAHTSNAEENTDNGTMSLTLVGQEGQKVITLGESSFSQSCGVEAEDKLARDT